MDGDQPPRQDQDMSLTEFLLEDGQVVSELPDRRDATNYVEINVEPRDYESPSRSSSHGGLTPGPRTSTGSQRTRAAGPGASASG